MNILVTAEKGYKRDIYFPDEIINILNKLGNVKFNKKDKPYTSQELKNEIKDIDICITHWGCPKFTKEIVDNANKLKLIAHAAGSVAYFITDYVYDNQIIVCSANSIMAKYVAEANLAYILSALRLIPQHNYDMKYNKGWNRKTSKIDTLFDKKVGLIGLGTIGRYLIELTKPFSLEFLVYDPYISKSDISKYPNVKLASMNDVLTSGDIISIQASLTPETYHMVDSKKLKLLKDNTLFINTSRGPIVEEKALIKELESGRIFAVLDVFEDEPLDEASKLRDLENVILIPHMGGAPAREDMTYGIIDEIKRYINNKPLKYEIPRKQFKLMTREIK